MNEWSHSHTFFLLTDAAQWYAVICSAAPSGGSVWNSTLRGDLTSSCVSFSGVAALDSRASGKMGMRAVIYYTTTTIIAVIIGIVMVLIIHPGKGSKDEFTKQQKIEQVSAADAFLDLIR